jgi:hypothetical protein
VDKVHEVSGLVFDGDQMQINIDGKGFVFALKEVSPRLLKASKTERETFEVSPSGYGIRWPMVDEDLSIDGLLGIKHQPLRSEIST